ncbi:MAG: hypothetical protein V4559_12110 [Pseudomonadota bacterium]
MAKSIWYRRSPSGLYTIVGWGWVAAAVLGAVFLVWGWFAADVMHWPFESVIIGGGVLMFSGIALFALHTEETR